MNPSYCWYSVLQLKVGEPPTGRRDHAEPAVSLTEPAERSPRPEPLSPPHRSSRVLRPLFAKKQRPYESRYPPGRGIPAAQNRVPRIEKVRKRPVIACIPEV